MNYEPDELCRIYEQYTNGTVRSLGVKALMDNKLMPWSFKKESIFGRDKFFWFDAMIIFCCFYPKFLIEIDHEIKATKC